MNYTFAEAQQNEPYTVSNVDLNFPDIGANGKPLATQQNLETLLNHLGLKPMTNQMTLEFEIFECGRLFDSSFDGMRSLIVSECLKAGLPKSVFEDHLMALAEKNTYHPFRNYLDSDKWDGVERVLPLIEAMNAKDPDIARAVMLRFFISVVASVFEPRFSSKLIPILQGGQSFKKTAFIRRFADVLNGAFLEGAELNPDNKDSVLACIKSLITELGELERTSKNSQGGLKAFITREVDTVRPPYGRTEIKKKRQTSLIATVNGSEFLRDETGSSRFAVLELEKPIDIERVNTILGWSYVSGRLKLVKPEQLKQFWLEVMQYYLDGESWLLNTDESTKVAKINQGHDYKGNWYDMLYERFVGVDPIGRSFKWMTATDVCNYCDVGQNNCRSIGVALKRLATEGLIESKKGSANKTFYKLNVV
ncbi:VapE domain-containing protein [Vibrio breoganii]